MSKDRELLEDWASTLTLPEALNALVQCVEYLIMTEDIRIDDEGEPYWESCGDRLVDNDE